jgi:BirA family biotin operon repressor/biotin-[acetyl-CoA-carboxylase] ligase
LSLLAALAFAETAESELGLEVQLKWPNDGLISGRKVCGVLVELSAEVDRVHYAICGVGINVAHSAKDFPSALRKTAGSLAMSKGAPVDRLGFYRSFLLHFETIYRRFRHEGLSPLLPAYRQRSLLLGKKVAVRQGREKISGVAVAIDDTGGLVVRTGKKEIVAHSGEATLR